MSKKINPNQTQQHDPQLQAAKWLMAGQGAQLSEADAKAFQAWLEADPQNVLEYELMDMIWQTMDGLRDDPDLARDRLLCVAAEACSAEADQRSGSRWFGGILNGRPLWKPAALGSGIVAATLAVLVVWTNTDPQLSYETGVGEQQSFTLSDSSVIELNTDSLVNIEYTQDYRRIELRRGEAVFSVAHEPDRPFEVTTDTLTAIALGTEFVVQRLPQATRVTVIDGRVNVKRHIVDEGRPDTKESNLVRGQGLELRKNDEAFAVVSVDTTRIDAWRRGRLEFDQKPLRDVISEINRYRETKIVIGSEEIADLEVSGIFRIVDTDQFLDTLEMALPVRVSAEPDGRVVLSSLSD